DGDLRVLRGERREQLLAAHVRHVEIEEDEAERLRREEPGDLARVGAGDEVVDAGAAESDAQRAQPGRLVVHREDRERRIVPGGHAARSSGTAGKVRTTAVPPPGGWRNSSAPPCSFTMAADTERPSPVPP